MSDGDFYLLAFTDIDATQRQLIHSAVTGKASNATSVWHGFDNLWIVSGGTVTEWQELTAPFVPKSPSGVVIFQLPPTGMRKWSGRAAKAKWEGLLSSYANVDGSDPKHESGI